MSKKAPTKLPDKPSALIRLALKDLEKCERSRKYKINMSVWHEPNGKCSVCMAGAIMAQRLNCDPGKELAPWQDGLFDADTRGKLDAVDWFRMGCVDMGLHGMGIDRIYPDQKVTDYHRDRSQFKRDMRKLASLLAKEGL